jgi:hypothetical protein
MYTKILMAALIMPCFWAQADTDTVVNCPSALGKSTAIIHALLVDLNKNYTHTAGGGITEIRQSASDSFVISVAQEERIDQFHYRIKIDDNCRVQIIHKAEATKSFRSQK